MRALLVLFGLSLVSLASVSPAAATAKPDDPNGYAEVVKFGAREDHDLYPGPGNVIGDVRSEIASGDGTKGVSGLVEVIKGFTGSTPHPPGLN